MIKLSVTIITLNEEKNIGRCVASVQDIADEIVVVDSFSTDKTKSICESFKGINLKFIENKFLGHIEQKNFALNLASYDYVLSLDADEALSDELILEIKKVKKDFKFSGYSFNRLTNYAGFWVRHCGWYPDRKLRLIKKDSAKWMGVNPHDILKLTNNETEMKLNGDLLHYSYDSISSHINQTNKFTSIAASEAYSRGIRSSVVKIVTRPVLKFLRDYFLKLGFLEGRYGFIICMINALSALLKYSKLYEIQIGKRP
jgi:glycosyltransferase involved in cell wall biosynthesis